MLDHHPEISFAFEFEYAVDRLDQNGKLPKLSDFHAYLHQHRIFNHAGFAIDPKLDYRSLVYSFLEQKRKRDGKRFVGATVHHAFDRLPSLWPKARFIHLLRDPRDVARSVINMGWAGNVYTASNVWKKAETECWEALRRSLPGDRWIELHYEELIREPRWELAKICDFIGPGFDGAMFDYVENSTYEAPDPKLIYQWKRKLTEREVRLVEAALGPWIEKRGYEMSGLPAMKIGPLRHQWLRTNCRINRARFRMRRYGLSLYLQDHFTRRVAIGPWRNSVQRRIRAINESFIR